MTDLYDFLKARIETKLPKEAKIRTVEPWNNQIQAQEDRKQTAFRYNAIFIEFLPEETRHIGHGVKDRQTIVRFHFAIKNYKRDKRVNIAFYEEFDSYFEGVANSSSAPLFSALRQVTVEWDSDHDGIALPYVDYRTNYRDFSGYIYRGFTDTEGIEPDPSAEITDEI